MACPTCFRHVPLFRVRVYACGAEPSALSHPQGFSKLIPESRLAINNMAVFVRRVVPVDEPATAAGSASTGGLEDIGEARGPSAGGDLFRSLL